VKLPRIAWSRISTRLLLAVAFVVGVVCFAALVLPFDTAASDGGSELACGPALFELLVPDDPEVPSPEDQGCDDPARTRSLVAGAGLLAAVGLAVGVEVASRRGSERSRERWLEGRRAR
jgi:hypothetical protein